MARDLLIRRIQKGLAGSGLAALTISLLLGTSIANAKMMHSPVPIIRHTTKVSAMPVMLIKIASEHGTAKPQPLLAGGHEIKIPVYPGSISMQGKQDAVVVVRSSSPYLWAGSATFVVAAPPDQVTNWFIATMPRLGFIGAHSSHVGDPVRRRLLYHLKSMPALTAELDVKRSETNPQHTDIGYWITNSVTSQRPNSSLIREGIQRLEVQYQPVSQGDANAHAVTSAITSQVHIKELVNQINHLPIDIRTSFYGGTALRGGAKLRFIATSSQVITVHIDPQRNQVQVGNGPKLFDITNRVWTTLSAFMGYDPYITRQ